jgi:putative ATPase
LTLDAWQVLERLGSPEGELALAQAVVYLACAAKSNAVYKAAGAAAAAASESGSLEVPLRLRNAPTTLMKGLGHGDGYRYAHDEGDGFAAGESYFPDDMQAATYYHPVPRGLEIRIREKLEDLRRRNAERQGASGNDDD